MLGGGGGVLACVRDYVPKFRVSYQRVSCDVISEAITYLYNVSSQQTHSPKNVVLTLPKLAILCINVATKYQCTRKIFFFFFCFFLEVISHRNAIMEFLRFSS